METDEKEVGDVGIGKDDDCMLIGTCRKSRGRNTDTGDSRDMDRLNQS